MHEDGRHVQAVLHPQLDATLCLFTDWRRVATWLVQQVPSLLPHLGVRAGEYAGASNQTLVVIQHKEEKFLSIAR